MRSFVRLPNDAGPQRACYRQRARIWDNRDPFLGADQEPAKQAQGVLMMKTPEDMDPQDVTEQSDKAPDDYLLASRALRYWANHASGAFAMWNVMQAVVAVESTITR